MDLNPRNTNNALKLIASDSDTIRFASENDALQLLATLLNKTIKVAAEGEFEDEGNHAAIESTMKILRKAFDSQDKKEMEGAMAALDNLFTKKFPLQKEKELDEYRYGIKNMIVEVLKQLSASWKKYESSQKQIDLFNKAIEATKKFGKQIGYTYTGPRGGVPSHGVVPIRKMPVKERAVAANKEKKRWNR